MFRVTKCPEEDKVEIATYYLEGTANRWRETLRVSRTSDPEFKWADFLVLLRGRFYPVHLQQAKLEEFVNLVQGAMDVEEYFEKFTVLAQFAPELVATEAAKISKF